MPSCTTCLARRCENASGNWVQPSEFADAVALESDQLKPDLEQKLDGVYSSMQPAAYPISAYSYLITAEGQTNRQKGAVEGRFIMFLACKGQQSAGALGYSPLPPNLVADDFKAVARIAGAAPPPSAPTASNCQNPYVDGSTPLPGQHEQHRWTHDDHDGTAGRNTHDDDDDDNNHNNDSDDAANLHQHDHDHRANWNRQGSRQEKHPRREATAPEASAGRLLRCTDDDAPLRRGPPRGGQRSRQILQRHELHAGLGSGSAPVGRHSPGNSADPAQTRPRSTGTGLVMRHFRPRTAFAIAALSFGAVLISAVPSLAMTIGAGSSGHASQVTATSSSPGKKAACATGFVCRDDSLQLPYLGNVPSVELGPVKDLGIGQYVFIKFRDFPPNDSVDVNYCTHVVPLVKSPPLCDVLGTQLLPAPQLVLPVFSNGTSAISYGIMEDPEHREPAVPGRGARNERARDLFLRRRSSLLRHRRHRPESRPGCRPHTEPRQHGRLPGYLRRLQQRMSQGSLCQHRERLRDREPASARRSCQLQALAIRGGSEHGAGFLVRRHFPRSGSDPGRVHRRPRVTRRTVGPRRPGALISPSSRSLRPPTSSASRRPSDSRVTRIPRTASGSPRTRWPDSSRTTTDRRRTLTSAVALRQPGSAPSLKTSTTSTVSCCHSRMAAMFDLIRAGSLTASSGGSARLPNLPFDVLGELVHDRNNGAKTLITGLRALGAKETELSR